MNECKATFKRLEKVLRLTSKNQVEKVRRKQKILMYMATQELDFKNLLFSFLCVRPTVNLSHLFIITLSPINIPIIQISKRVRKVKESSQSHSLYTAELVLNPSFCS